MPRPHLHEVHVKARPVRATYDNSREIEWDVAISWQLRSQRGCYVVFVAVPGVCPSVFRGNRVAWFLRDRFTYRCDRGINQ